MQRHNKRKIETTTSRKIQWKNRQESKQPISRLYKCYMLTSARHLCNSLVEAWCEHLEKLGRACKLLPMDTKASGFSDQIGVPFDGSIEENGWEIPNCRDFYPLSIPSSNTNDRSVRIRLSGPACRSLNDKLIDYRALRAYGTPIKPVIGDTVDFFILAGFSVFRRRPITNQLTS